MHEVMVAGCGVASYCGCPWFTGRLTVPWGTDAACVEESCVSITIVFRASPLAFRAPGSEDNIVFSA